MAETGSKQKKSDLSLGEYIIAVWRLFDAVILQDIESSPCSINVVPCQPVYPLFIKFTGNFRRSLKLQLESSTKRTSLVGKWSSFSIQTFSAEKDSLVLSFLGNQGWNPQPKGNVNSLIFFTISVIVKQFGVSLNNCLHYTSKDQRNHYLVSYKYIIWISNFPDFLKSITMYWKNFIIKFGSKE